MDCSGGAPAARNANVSGVAQALRVGLFTEIYHPVVNGVVASVDALAVGLERRGHKVFCFAPQMPGAGEAEGPVVRIPSLPLPTSTPYRLTLPLVGRRETAVIRRLSMIHAHSPFVTGWMGMRYARRYGIPLVYTYHTQLEAYAHYVPFEPNATRFAASQLTRTFANHVDAVIAPTPAMTERLRELGVTTRIETVPSGIDLAAFAAGRRRDEVRRRAGASNSDRLLLYVGRLAKEKNLDMLLEALALARPQSKGLRLAIAGDGPVRRELEEAARLAGIAGQVRFLGMLDRAELPDLYAGADAFVMPSTTETQGIVQVEALAAGAYVIAAATPQNRDVVGDAGVLAQPSAGAFAEALAKVPLRPDPAFAARAQRAAERFSIERQIDRTLALYESLAAPARIA